MSSPLGLALLAGELELFKQPTTGLPTKTSFCSELNLAWALTADCDGNTILCKIPREDGLFMAN
jgi:hypothetical protein